MRGFNGIISIFHRQVGKDVHNNILQRTETHMYEQVFSPDKENDERSFDEI